jgi:cytochrome c553
MRSRAFRWITCSLLLGIATAGQAEDDYSLVPDTFVYCTTCHGVELRGNIAVDAPRLNGMEGWYLKTQMLAFKNGHRGAHPQDLIGMEMQPQAEALTEEQIEDIVAFVTVLPVRTHTIERTVSGDTDRGEALYTTCSACHGAEGEGNRLLNAPALAGQSDWYLVRQLDKYRAGARGYDPADTFGQQMKAATAVLAVDEDVRDVVAYINTLLTN